MKEVGWGNGGRRARIALEKQVPRKGGVGIWLGRKVPIEHVVASAAGKCGCERAASLCTSLSEAKHCSHLERTGGAVRTQGSVGRGRGYRVGA